ncbi:putative gamma-glutamylcyclotransferase At3g02910 [Alnus glutinosa]|uniref:putative gamma-glutamylcyclotransferase At3g02910 n=1 Tax=Alnus glutinosa TaxID=3517 RepID=UPI002D77EBFC|nr:putative gamma-glutamylcyclotransferase At3g02910 [Alnus glutinosa]
MADESKPHVIFTYGTLKRGFPNYHLMQSLIDQNDAVFLGPHMTLHAYPLVCGAHGIPFLINLPGSGFRVTGDLYSVSTRGLVRVDELEGTRLGHYERLPVQVIHTNAPDGVVPVQADAYFAHRSFGEGLWERNGRKGMSEYTEREARGYVRREDRPKDRTFLDEVRFFLCSDAKNDSPLE